jgi:UDP-N-acetylmuramate: L-alanyl-gamma-D-glutamyl-meso-diaminopimelate ligase
LNPDIPSCVAHPFGAVARPIKRETVADVLATRVIPLSVVQRNKGTPGNHLAAGRIRFSVPFSALSSPQMFGRIQSVHFVGICGTAMASTAAALKQQGVKITGSDQNVYPPMSTFLAERGIEVIPGYAEQNLTGKPDLVVIGNAISRGNPEAEYVLDHKLRYCSLPELLKEYFIRGKKSLVVSGTHGKTTTTSLLAWVFESNGLNPSFLIGGLPNNFAEGARFTNSEWFIIEGDEYDTAFFDKRSKFVHYLPEVAVINNVELDHADIFPNLETIKTSFRHFIRLIPRNGLLLGNGDDENLGELLNVTHCPVKRFGLGEDNAVQAFNIRYGPTATEFEIPSFKFHMNLVGEFNVRNALAVIGCAKHFGLKNHQIQAAFETFKGVKRRMEVRGIPGGVTVIDDFGHHPTAIRETLRALRIKYGRQKIWAVFEPRTNTTRRNIFQNELPGAFGDADAVIISQIARLELIAPEERLDPTKLMRDLEAEGKTALYLPDVDIIVARLAKEAQGGDVICIFSNGGFGGIHTKLIDRLTYR